MDEPTNDLSSFSSSSKFQITYVLVLSLMLILAAWQVIVDQRLNLIGLVSCGVFAKGSRRAELLGIALALLCLVAEVWSLWRG